MSNYVLSIDLVGGEKAQSILASLQSSMAGLKSGGSVFTQGNRDVSDIARSLNAGGKLTAKMASDMDKISSISKDISKANKVMGGNIFGKEGGAKSFWERNKHLLVSDHPADKALMSGESQSSSFGGGIGAINNPAMAMQEFGNQVDELFKATPEAKLASMQKKANQKFELEQEKLKAKDLATASKEKSLYGSAIVSVNRDLDKKSMKALSELYNPSWLKKFGGAPVEAATNWKKALLGVGAGVFNPWIGSRILSDVFKGAGGAGGGGGTAKGIFGAGGAMGFTEFYLAFKLVQKAFEALKYVIMETVKAFETARQLYAKALTGGMGLQWTAKRGLLASIMGVSEQDVFRFGAQMAYLNPKLEQASRILAQTAPSLTAVSWQFKVLEADLSAGFAQIAQKFAPAVLTILDSLDSLVKGIEKHATAIKWAILAVNPAARAVAAWNWFLGKGSGKDDIAKMPSPQSWMKQLVASGEEHRGLVVGGGGMNYQRDISKNTRMMAAGIKELVHLSQRSKYSRNSWGMSGTVNNP